MDRIASLVVLLVGLSLVYGQAIGFAICHFAESIISFRSFLVKSLGSPLNRITPPASRATLRPSFPICTPFTSFSYLADLTRTPSTILNRK